MEFVFHALASCRDGLAAVTASPFSLPASLFLGGLAASALHCAGMCGPFVLGQVMAGAERIGVDKRYGGWQRLAGAALVPYHLGRFVTYSFLGGLAGAATSMFASTELFGWLAAFLLVLGAGLVGLQAFGLALGAAAPQAPWIQQLAARFLGSRHPIARFGLGVTLGFLPCGLVYGALGAAAGTGAALNGAVAMAAFALGTVPALVAVGWGGLMLRRSLGGAVRWVAAPLLLLSSMLMLALAAQRL